MATPLPVLANLDLIVSSYGGVGTSFLMHFFNEHLKLNDPHNTDGLKHAGVPPLTLKRRLRALYLYDDPRLATLSLFRRGYHHAHSRSMGVPDPVRPEENLEAYLSHGMDRFALGQHFHAWRDQPRPYPILFLRSTALWQHLPELMTYLGLSSELASQFPAQKKRESHLDTLPEATLARLDQLYGPLCQELNALPDWHLREATPMVYLKQLPQLAHSTWVYRSGVYPRLIFNSYLKS